MSTRPIMISLAAVLALTALAGCGKTRGMEARERAKDRLNVVNAKLSADQAEQAFRTGQFEKAVKEVKAALELQPESARYHLLEGRIYLETHRLEKAIESFDKAAELDPELAKAKYYAGVVYQRWSDDAKAYDRYMEAYELDSNSVSYLLAAAESMIALDQYGAANRLLESNLVRFEHNSAMRQLLGQLAMLQGEASEAVVYLEDARRLNPEDEILIEELAQAQYAAGLYKDCLRSVKSLQELAVTEQPDLLLFEARCLTLIERLPEARNLYLKLTRLRPTEVAIWIELGTVAWELGDYHRMALCGARITALAPDQHEGYLLKGINERHHGNLPEALLYLRQAADRATDTALPHLVLGQTLEEAQDREGALEAYARAIHIEPDSPEANLLFNALTEGEDPMTAGVHNE